MTDYSDNEYSYAYDADDYDENEYEYAYEDVDNKMSALYVDKGEKCKSPSLCDDVTCTSPSLCDAVPCESPSLCDDGAFELPSMSDIVDDDVHLGIHALNTKKKDDIEQVNSVKSVKPYYAEMSIEGKSIKMEVDTGASRTTISEHVYETQFKHVQLRPTDVLLRSYTGDVVPIIGELSVNVCHEEQKHKLNLLVVRGKCPSLLGRDWLGEIRLNWANVFIVSGNDVNTMLKRYCDVFVPDSKGIQGLRAHVKVKTDVQPVYQKPRPVPYALLQKVDEEYDRLIANNILYPVDYSHWGTPVVCVQKADGEIRICGDYKQVNQRITSDGYKLPNIQDLLAKLTQGNQPKVFSCLDLSGAFNQLLLDEEAAKVLVLNTHRGLLATKRLTYGVKVAPAQFQAAIDKILAGIPNVTSYIDDVLVATRDEQEHLETLKKVLARFEKYNVKLNKSKCQFLKREAKYLGHKISGDGIKPLQNKVDAIKKAPIPKDVTELKSFLGMVNFYRKFVKNMSSELHPLYELPRGDAQFRWKSEQQKAFNFAKDAVTNAEVLAHYDPDKDLTLTVDASPYGVGAVISHTSADGIGKPIAFASRSLNSAEKNYAQIQREALAIIFGVKKFHMYLYGRRFTLETDHKPLSFIFSPTKDIPSTAAARMQRWALILSGYEYDIKHRRGEDNAHADMLSRLPVDGPETADSDEQFILKTTVDTLPVTAKQISLITQRCPVLSKVFQCCLSGWPHVEMEDELEPFYRRRYELSLEDGCVLWGSRVVVPEKYRVRILEELHECHPGMCRMKALAQSYVWWPGLDEDIEEQVRHCMECAESAQLPKKQPLLLWPWTSEPMQRKTSLK